MEEIACMFGAIARQQGVVYRKTGGTLAGLAIAKVALLVAVLIRQHLSWIPRGREEAAEDAAVTAPVAIEVRPALPGTDRRQMGRLQARHLPLRDRIVGDTQQADSSVGPFLNT